jgi:hypothetical protein
MLLGLGTSVVAFPKKVISLTIDEITPVLELRQDRYESYLLEKKAKGYVGRRGFQCVTFVRKFLDTTTDIVPSMAKHTKTNSQTPEIGAIIVTNESKYGHVGAVIDYTDDWVKIVESNVPLGSELVGIRTLKINDKKIIGYALP